MLTYIQDRAKANAKFIKICKKSNSMILGRADILRRIENKNIVIKPFRIENIGPASIDLTLGNEFRIFDKTRRTIEITEQTDYRKYTKKVVLKKTKKGYLEISPGELVLGITKEKITLPENVAGWLGGRSRFARLGLMVHVTSSFVQPGSRNKQVLEIKNMSPYVQRLKPGVKVCQLFLEELSESEKYKGKWSKQDSI